MPTDGKNQLAKKTLQKFARTLLATTCLTGVSTGIALGSVITEGTPPAPADFPNAPNGFLLPVGTTEVNGSHTNFQSTDPSGDWFEFQGLLGGATFSLTATGVQGVVFLQSDGGASVGSPVGFITGFPANIGPLSVPADGKLVVGIVGCEVGTCGYTIDLTAPTTIPEPSTFAGVGLALAGALSWRRKRSV
jgi:hypothetical protein